MSAKILVAGVGNIFLGDDGFGVEVALSLSKRQLPESVQVKDFGIRGFDLAYALARPLGYGHPCRCAIARRSCGHALRVGAGSLRRGASDQSTRHGSGGD